MKIYQTLETVFHPYPNTSNSVKNTPLRVVFSTLFSVFGYPDETLFLVFDILLEESAKCGLISSFEKIKSHMRAAARLCLKNNFQSYETRKNCTMFTTRCNCVSLQKELFSRAKQGVRERQGCSFLALHVHQPTSATINFLLSAIN